MELATLFEVIFETKLLDLLLYESLPGLTLFTKLVNFNMSLLLLTICVSASSGDDYVTQLQDHHRLKKSLT